MKSKMNPMPDNEPQNPFEYTRPIVDKERYIPRVGMVQNIINELYGKNNVSVMGAKRTGKTTLLFDLRERLDRAVYIDFKKFSYSDIGEVLSDLHKNADKQISNTFDELIVEDGNSTHALVKMLHVLGECAPVVFLIDELPTPREVAYQFLVAVRAYYLEAIAESAEKIHTFVIAGSVDLAVLTQDMNPDISPFNIAIPLYLKDFSYPEIQEFIHRLAVGRFEDREIEKIFRYTGGYPFLVQFVCHHLYGMTKGKREEILQKPDIAVRELPLEKTPSIKDMLGRIGAFDERDRPGAVLIKRILRGERVLFNFANKQILGLYLDGAIREDEDGYCAIRNPLYEVVLRRALDIPNAEEPEKVVPEKGTGRKSGRRKIPGRIIEIYG
uniref:AAA-like domain-containing protein n=1 Tax=Candidatus Kentrum sp. LFY TaxID=2126342 RepID=A0A450UG25_9GAMM|nr:MAG: AAA-like domain-containing protein [Candidatus Kentron sp. LFY]